MRRNAGVWQGLCVGIGFVFSGYTAWWAPFVLCQHRRTHSLEQSKIIHTNVRPDLVYCLYPERPAIGPTAPFTGCRLRSVQGAQRPSGQTRRGEWGTLHRRTEPVYGHRHQARGSLQLIVGGVSQQRHTPRRHSRRPASTGTLAEWQRNQRWMRSPNFRGAKAPALRSPRTRVL